MIGIVIDIVICMATECEICGTVHNLDRHHVIPKRMGGRDDPAIDDPTNLMTICRGCHQKIHRGTWTIQRSPELLRVTEQRTGDQVMRRHYDQCLDAPAVLHLLNIAEGSLSTVLESIPYLSDDQLVEVFGYLRDIGKRSWLIKAGCFTRPRGAASMATEAWKQSLVVLI